jgi:aldehyde:ferredoxin oxidoreductase
MRQSGNRNGVRNQIGMCHFLAYEDDQILTILNTVTGWGATQDEVVTTAHRGITLTRLYNMREGFTRADDRLPDRFAEPLPKHPGFPREAQEKIVTDYYVEYGWDPATGVPTRETITKLAIEADAAHAM